DARLLRHQLDERESGGRIDQPRALAHALLVDLDAEGPVAHPHQLEQDAVAVQRVLQPPRPVEAEEEPAAAAAEAQSAARLIAPAPGPKASAPPGIRERSAPSARRYCSSPAPAGRTVSSTPGKAPQSVPEIEPIQCDGSPARHAAMPSGGWASRSITSARPRN